jgi:hypothetical protein
VQDWPFSPWAFPARLSRSYPKASLFDQGEIVHLCKLIRLHCAIWMACELVDKVNQLFAFVN